MLRSPLGPSSSPEAVRHEAGAAAASGPSHSRALSKAQQCVCMPRGFVKCAKGRFFLKLFLKKGASKLYELQAHSSLDLCLLWLVELCARTLVPRCCMRGLIPPSGPGHRLAPSLLSQFGVRPSSQLLLAVQIRARPEKASLPSVFLIC